MATVTRSKPQARFTVTGALRRAWRIFGQRPWFLIGALALSAFAVTALSIATLLVPFIDTIVEAALAVLFWAGLTSFFLRAYDNIYSAALSDLWAPGEFWQFAITSALLWIATIVGLLLFIVPGLIVMTIFAFAPYLVLDQKLDPVSAFLESARITKGRRIDVFILLILTGVMNLLGLVALGLGMLVTYPVSSLAIASAYRLLYAERGRPPASTTVNRRARSSVAAS